MMGLKKILKTNSFQSKKYIMMPTFWSEDVNKIKMTTFFKAFRILMDSLMVKVQRSTAH